MRRLHVHLAVRDLEASVRFYSALFGAEPERREADYARFRLEDPAVNLALSTGSGSAGVDHLGLDLASETDLRALAERLERSGHALVEQEDAHCCYARSDKAWATDPAGLPWEAFHTRERSEERGADGRPEAPAHDERPAAAAPSPSDVGGLCC